MFLDVHAAIVIFGGSFATTLIRFPLSSIFHGLPLGAKFAFSLRRMSQRDLVDELAGRAEVRPNRSRSWRWLSTLYGAAVANLLCLSLPTSCNSSWWTRKSTAR